MSSVTKRISEIKQPRGGYLSPSRFTVHKIEDEYVLNESENVHASVIGMAVDYLTRFAMETELLEAFKISCRGAKVAENIFKQKDATKTATKLLSGIKRIDEDSIINACKLVTYDVWFRNPMGAIRARGVDETNPDKDTIKNIEILVKRSLKFWEDYDPIVKDGFTFEPYGYTQTVDAGDGDFLTKDTLWDFKVSKSKPTSKHTLQLLMYWIMGQHSGNDDFKGITKLGIFNPRLNTVYTFPISKIEQKVIKIIETEVICY